MSNRKRNRSFRISNYGLQLQGNYADITADLPYDLSMIAIMRKYLGHSSIIPHLRAYFYDSFIPRYHGAYHNNK